MTRIVYQPFKMDELQNYKYQHHCYSLFMSNSIREKDEKIEALLKHHQFNLEMFPSWSPPPPPQQKGLFCWHKSTLLLLQSHSTFLTTDNASHCTSANSSHRQCLIRFINSFKVFAGYLNLQQTADCMTWQHWNVQFVIFYSKVGYLPHITCNIQTKVPNNCNQCLPSSPTKQARNIHSAMPVEVMHSCDYHN